MTLDLSFDDDLSFEALRFCCTFWNADIAEEATDVLETSEMSDPEPNSFSSLFLVNFLSFPMRPAFFFFPWSHSDAVDMADRFDSRLPVDNLSTDVSLSRRLIDMAL